MFCMFITFPSLYKSLVLFYVCLTDFSEIMCHIMYVNLDVNDSWRMFYCKKVTRHIKNLFTFSGEFLKKLLNEKPLKGHSYPLI